MVGIPSLSDTDRFRSYREDIIAHVERALVGVDYEVFVTPPCHYLGIEGIVECSNLLIDKCVDEGYDFLWIVQGDVQIPGDAFEKLYALDVDVAQGVVPRHDDPQVLIAGFMDETAKVWYLPRNAVEDQILTGWVFAGMSCTLIKRRVLEDPEIRFKYQSGIGEDVLFLYTVQKNGFVARVHGGVVCGHLPEWPLTTRVVKPVFGVLDVGCGHRSKGDVNVDLFVEATAHRAADQRINDDVALHVHEIPNFVRADACHLPFRDGAFKKCYSWHVIEHLIDPEAFLRELMRVSADKIEVRCPNGEYLSCKGETKPLHLHDFSLFWFREKLAAYPDWDFSVRWDYSQSEPWEIVVEGEVKA